MLFPADYDAEFDAVFGRRPRPVDDPTVYICAPDDPAIYRTAVQVLRAMRDFPEADRVAKAAAQRFPDDPSIRKLSDKAAKIEEEELLP